MSHVKTSGKGAVVIPLAVRRTVGLVPGQTVEVSADGNNRIVIVPLARDPVAALEGILRGKGGGTVDEFLRGRRREDRRRKGRL